MSARAYDRILRVARTIADLGYAACHPDLDFTSASEEALRTAVNAPIRQHHIAEAIGYRAMDRACVVCHVANATEILYICKKSSMTKKNQVQLFNDKRVRTVWDSETKGLLAITFTEYESN